MDGREIEEKDIENGKRKKEKDMEKGKRRREKDMENGKRRKEKEKERKVLRHVVVTTSKVALWMLKVCSGCFFAARCGIHAALNSFQPLPILFNPVVNVHTENAVPSFVLGPNSFTIEMHCLHLCGNYHTLFPSRWYLASQGTRSFPLLFLDSD